MTRFYQKHTSDRRATEDTEDSRIRYLLRLRGISVCFVSPRWLVALALILTGAHAQTTAKSPIPPPVREGFPFTDETLHYSMNWQSGLSLGDAAMTAHRTGGGWDFTVTVNAGVPGFAIADKYTSSTDTGICSQELGRETSHGGRRTSETTSFDQHAGTARRVTLFPSGGGKSTYEIPSCARDALAYAYYARIELGQGRVPSPQQVFFGSPYTVRLDYGGAQNITIDQKNTVTDKLMVSIRGPKSDSSVEILFARDSARTPLRIRIPGSLGTFTLELVP